MPLPRHIAVIDIGKTNAKVVLIDSGSRAQVAARSMPNTVRRDGVYPHMDVERLWSFILSSLRDIHAEHGIDGVSITTHGATAALLAGGELALPVLDYEFNGPEETAAEYALVRPEFAESLSPRLPNGLNLGAQIFWQSRTFADVFSRVTHVVTYPQYWAWRLTGVLASEVTSLGCHTDLWRPDAADFSRLVDRQGWRKLFPELRPAASVLGSVTDAVAEATGLPVGTQVACGIHDSNASLLPHLGAGKGTFTILSTGTWAIAMTVGGDTLHLDPARDSLANVDAYGRPVPTARFMGGREFDLLVPDIREPRAAELDRVIGETIQVLPSFVPGVGPFPHGTGAWTHPPSTLTAGERTAAASLYLALMTQASLGLCGLGSKIIVEGPLARNRLFGEALAALTGVPVSMSGDATGTSLGASLLFGTGEIREDIAPVVRPLNHDGFSAYAAKWVAQVG